MERVGRRSIIFYDFNPIGGRIDENIGHILAASEYMDIFSEELPGLPSCREVEFSIDLVVSGARLTMASYRMTFFLVFLKI